MKGKGKVFSIIGGTFLVLAAAIGGLYARQNAILTEKHDKALARAKSLGLGVDSSFFESSVPDAQNAAVQMHIDFRKGNGIALPKSAPTAWKPGADKAEFAALIASAPQANMVAAAAKLPYWAPKRDYSVPLLTLFPEFSHVKDYVKYFCFKGYFESEQGNWDQATEDFKTASRLAALMRQERTMIGMLVHIACNAIVQNYALKIVVASSADPRAVKLYDEAQKLLLPADFPTSIGGESAFIVTAAEWYCDHPSRFAEFASDVKIPPHLPPNKLRLTTTVLNYYSNLISVIPNKASDFRAEEAALTAVPEPTAPIYTGEGFFYSIAFPVFVQAYQAVHKDLVADKLAKIGLQILVYKRENGKYPAKLTDLKPTPDLTDPYSGSDLLYVASAEDFTVYSVGSDGVDTTRGGVPKITPADIMFQTFDSSRSVIWGR